MTDETIFPIEKLAHRKLVPLCSAILNLADLQGGNSDAWRTAETKAYEIVRLCQEMQNILHNRQLVPERDQLFNPGEDQPLPFPQ